MRIKRFILMATVLAWSAGSTALAGARVEMNDLKDGDLTRQQVDMHARYDHPKTQVIENKNLRIDITRDAIMHSCCMPPNLVVAGKITNIGALPVDYIRLNFAFEDKNGKILHAESLYNHKAGSLGDDENVQRILNEKPHFEALQPGASDTFAFEIPCNLLPEFQKVELYPTGIKP